MKFGYTIIYVKDIKQTVDFYQRAFGLSLKFYAESGKYAELSTGETILSFVAEDFIQEHGMEFVTNRVDNVSPGFQISFITENVAEAYEKAIKEGASKISPPKQVPWGQIVSQVKDNNGIVVEIGSPIGAY
jgi:predicted enzyme related to lactoylglutathione lyase